MKREALSSPKLMSLCGHLGVSKAQAIGHLTLLWDFTAEHATAGDVGKWDDETIARACDWTGDGHAFVGGLIASRWVDTCTENRLVVWDWAEHCENWVRAKAQRLKLPLLRRGLKNPSYDSLKNGTYVATQEQDYVRAAEPTLPKPTQPTVRAREEYPPNGATTNERGEPFAFTVFMSEYPRDIDREDALTEWWRIPPDNTVHAEIMAGLKRWKASAEWKREDGRYIPSAAKFLNKKRWKASPAGTQAENDFTGRPFD